MHELRGQTDLKYGPIKSDTVEQMVIRSDALPLQ